MSALGAFSDIVTNVTKYALLADKRLTQLRQTVDGVSASATASAVEKMVANSVGLWLDALDLWMSFVPQKGDQPAIMLITSPNTAVGVKHGEVAIKDPGATVTLAVSPISRVGGTETLAVTAAGPTLSIDRQTLSLDVVVPAGAVRGLYEGAVYAQPQTPVAVVLVVLT